MNLKRIFPFGIVSVLLIGCASLQPRQVPLEDLQPEQAMEPLFGQDIQYLIYLPPDYKENRGKKYPFMLFLHGAGERGNDITLVKKHGPPMMIENGWHPDFIVVSPQCPEEERWNVDLLEKLVKKLIVTYNIDEDRMYLTGLSMGGFGTWAYATKYPDRWAAIVPICGGGDLEKVNRITHIPVIAYHGAKDNTVPMESSREMIDALNAAGGNASLVIYPEKGHDSWTETYYDRTLYEWLLDKRK